MPRTSIRSEPAARLALWLVLSLAIPLALFPAFWANLVVVVSPDYVFGQFRASPWGVFALCAIWLYLRRKDIRRQLGSRPGPFFIALGLASLVVAALMPSAKDFVVFQGLLASLGVFLLLFGRAAKMPALMLAIYGFAVSFPLLVERFAEQAYATTALAPLLGLLSALGYPIASQGSWLELATASGKPIVVAVTAACAGPATMAVFVALFTLMMLDVPLPPRAALGLFLFGIVGTWFQSLLRLVSLMLGGYYFGVEALWTAHSYTIYVLFPLWYLIFAFVYFHFAGSVRGSVAVTARQPAGRTIGGG